MNAPAVRVIGCGNPHAGDDAAGFLAAAEARNRLTGLTGVEVVEAATGIRLLDLMGGAAAVVIVDAVRTPGGARPPGTLIRVEPGPGGLPVEPAGSLSSHGFGVAEALALATVLDRIGRIVLIGVEAGELRTGHPLSPEVAAALPSLVGSVEAEVRELLEEASR